MFVNQRYFIELAYEGTAYHGWQLQPNAVTVQEVLDKALSVVLRQKIETTGCGRTDTGVHARVFFAHFDLPKTNDRLSTENHENTLVQELPAIELIKLVAGVNALLPRDVAVKRVLPVHSEAHTRFDAVIRSYEYHVHFNKDPFKVNRSWQLRDIPDIALMNVAARLMMEYTDFSCFSKSNTQVFTNNCAISRAEWVYSDNCLVFHISANRFLRNMVRAIVGTLMQVGRKELEPEAIKTIIESKNRSSAGVSVPACGLYLTEVKYPYL